MGLLQEQQIQRNNMPQESLTFRTKMIYKPRNKVIVLNIKNVLIREV